MAKGDMTQGTAQGGAVPSGGGVGGNPNGASKSMNDILAMLSHLGIGPQNPIQQAGGSGQPQFGFNRPGAQGPMGMGQGNRNQLSPGHQGYMNNMDMSGNRNVPMNPNAAFGGGERQGIPFQGGGFHPPGMGSMMPSMGPRMPIPGNPGGGIVGPQQFTRQGSQMIDKSGQVAGHYGNNNEQVFNPGYSPIRRAPMGPV